MFGRKKVIYLERDDGLSDELKEKVEIASKYPWLANLQNDYNDLSENYQHLRNELAKYKSLYEDAKNAQPSTACTDLAGLKAAEERDRLAEENKQLKADLAACKNAVSGTSPAEAKLTEELAALKKELTWANSHAKDLEDALYNERAESAELKERLNNGGTQMSNEPTQWEYKTLNSIETASHPEELNKLGQQGWEVTGIAGTGNAFKEQIILKRPRQRDDDYGYSR